MRASMTTALAVALGIASGSAAQAQPYDHLKCYKMKDVQTFHSANADIETIEPTFGLQNCRIKKKAKQICIPATKDVTGIEDGTDTPFPVATDDLAFEQVCYKISCPQETIPSQTVSDQFGSRVVTNLKASTLCVPAVFGPPPVPTTTTTSSTTSTTMPPPATWSIRAGNGSDQRGVAIGVDSTGNVIVAGNFYDEIDFGLGALMSAGMGDVYVVKLDPNGVPIWNARFGDATDELALDLAVDANDNIVISGIFHGTIDFGGGPLSSNGLADSFVAALDENGMHVWSTSFGGGSNDYAFGVEVDPAGDVLVAGYFGSASVDFGGGAVARVGTNDCFVARFSSTGVYELEDTYGGAGAICLLSGIDTDPMGSLLLSGSLAGTVNFGGGALMGAGALDILLLKFTSGGMHVFSKIFGDSSTQQGATVSSDGFGNAYLTAHGAGTVDFGGGALMSAGGTDVFIAKLDGLGNHVWSKKFGDASSQTAVEVVADGSGNVHGTGSFAGTIDFGGGGIMSAGGSDGYIVKLDTMGSHLSSMAVAATGEQIAGRLVVDGSGNRYVTGSFENTINLGDGPLVSTGSFDVFVAKLAP